LSGAGFGGQMNDRVNATQRPFEINPLVNVTVYEFGPLGRGIVGIDAMDLWRQIIEYPDSVTGFRRHRGQMRADESGSPSDEKVTHLSTVFSGGTLLAIQCGFVAFHLD
jgi:hypothetical protein